MVRARLRWGLGYGMGGPSLRILRGLGGPVITPLPEWRSRFGSKFGGGAGFASGRHAQAICDRCGRAIRYTELQPQFVNRRATGLLVCSDCRDVDHPQYHVPYVSKYDPEALRNARPDTERVEVAGIVAWNPVWLPQIRCSLGTVAVNITT